MYDLFFVMLKPLDSMDTIEYWEVGTSKEIGEADTG